MLNILNKSQVEEFVNSIKVEYEFDEYYEEGFKYYDSCKYIGWIVDNSLKCFVTIVKAKHVGKLQFLQTITEKIVDVMVGEDDDYTATLFAKIAEEFPNIAVDQNDYMSYSYFENSYDSLIIKDPLKEDLYDNNVYMEDNLLISKNNETNFQKEFENLIKYEGISSLEYKIMDADGLREFMTTDHFWNHHLVGNNSNFLGFHYFSARNVNSYMEPKNLRFAVCVANKKDIVGVIKIADYTSGDLTYKGLNYIDVHIKYRRKGIAKGLYNVLNDYLSEDDILISSSLSNMGQEVRIDLTRKNCLTKIKNYDNINEYYKLLQLN